MTDYTGRRVIQLEEGWRDMDVRAAQYLAWRRPIARQRRQRPRFDPASGVDPATTLPRTLHVQAGINKLKRILEGEEEEQFNAEQYMMLYTCGVACPCIGNDAATLKIQPAVPHARILPAPRGAIRH